jgi:hypothetical protein
MSESNHQQVIEAIEDRFFETGMFSNVQDIADWLGLPKSNVATDLEDLDGSEVFRVYEGQGLPTVYITKGMKNSITSRVGEPPWIEEYEFEEKRDLREQVSEANENIRQYQSIERLLFGSGPPLEESVEFALTELGFDPTASANEEDFVIEEDNQIYVIEVKGVGGQIRKKHVTQLAGWIDLKIEEGVEPANLTGVLIHNHQRHDNPTERDEPLSEHARRFLGIRGAAEVSTYDLFNILKDMRESTDSVGSGRQELERARERFISKISPST